MAKFLIAATDKASGATVYAKVSPTGRVISFREGVGLVGSKEHFTGLNFHRCHATQLDGDVALQLLEAKSAALAESVNSWVRDLRIVVA